MAERRWSALSFDYFYTNNLLCFDSGPTKAYTGRVGLSFSGLKKSMVVSVGCSGSNGCWASPPIYIKTNLSPFPWTNFCVRPCKRACHLRLQWIDHYAMVIQGWHVLAQPILAKHTWYNMVKVRYFFSESYVKRK